MQKINLELMKFNNDELQIEFKSMSSTTNDIRL